MREGDQDRETGGDEMTKSMTDPMKVVFHKGGSE